jgi:predicted DNA-binding transcriptional regulator YafY
MPFAEAGRSALKKLTGVMASAPRSNASKLVSHIRVAQGPRSDASQAIAGVLQQALIDSVAVEVTYRDAEARETVRVVEPVGLVGTRHGWYLAAWCRLRQGSRAFRLDRIAQASLTVEPVEVRSLDAMLPELPFELAEPGFV